MDREQYECTDETFKRYEELSKKLDKQVYYNGEFYKVKEILSTINDFKHIPIVLLRPTKNVVVKGEAILNIKDSAISKQTIHCKDGTMNIKFEKIPYDGQEIDENGLVNLGEINE